MKNDMLKKTIFTFVLVNIFLMQIMSSAFAIDTTGSITVCKIIIDGNQNIIDGSSFSESTFYIDVTPPIIPDKPICLEKAQKPSEDGTTMASCLLSENP